MAKGMTRRRLRPDAEIPAFDDGIAAPLSGAEDGDTVLAAAVPRPALRPIKGAARETQHETNHATPRRTRRRKVTEQRDQFYIPLDEIPEGLSYEWKRYSVHGQEDPFYIADLREQGWEPVNPKRHPNWVPPGYNDPHIIKGGLILMERPAELTEEARAETRQLARRQVREAEQRLGMTPRDTLERVAPKLTKEIGRMIPTAIEE